MRSKTENEHMGRKHQHESDSSEGGVSRREAVKALGGLGLAGMLGGCASAGMTAAEEAISEGRRRRPNIVFIMADDLGYGDLGSYGQTKIRTPHLDQMAREGMRFTQFYAGSTVCAPSRSVLMTGQHTGHTPVRGNRRSSSPIGNAPLPAETETVARMLQRAGYATGAFGKWGLGGPDSEGRPTQQGFDEFFGYLDQLRAHFYYSEFLFRNSERVPLEGNEVVDDPPVPGAGRPVRRSTYSHDVIIEEALSFIERHEDEPFFLYLPVTIPHASLTAPEDAMAPYLDEAGDSIFPEDAFPGGHYPEQPMPRATYAAMVSRLDRDVGRVLETLRAQGLAEETIVFFTSDNGPHDAGGYEPSFFDSNGPFRGGKGQLYEGGLRVPMIAWGPGRVPAGATSYRVAYLGDVMATLAELVGVAPPKPNDSTSFLPTLLGQPDEQPAPEPLYWEYYARSPQQAVRDGKWKAVRRPMMTGEVELYNLQRDLSERRDVAEKHPKVVAHIEDIMAGAHTPSSIWKAPEPTK